MSAWLLLSGLFGRSSFDEQEVFGGEGERLLRRSGVASPGGRDAVSMLDSSSDWERDAGVGIPWFPSTTSVAAWLAGVIRRLLSSPSSQRTDRIGKGIGMSELSSNPWAVDFRSLI